MEKIKTSMDQRHEILILKAIRDLGYEPLEIYQEKRQNRESKRMYGTNYPMSSAARKFLNIDGKNERQRENQNKQ